MPACSVCLRSICCVCKLADRVEEASGVVFQSRFGSWSAVGLRVVLVYLMARVTGVLDYSLEGLLVPLLLIDASPLQRKEFAMESALLAAVLSCVPFIGPVCNAAATALTAAMVLPAVLLPSRPHDGDDVALLFLRRGVGCAVFAVLLLNGEPSCDSGFLSSLRGWFLCIALLWWSDCSSETTLGGLILYCRARLLHKVMHFVGVDVGLLYALRLDEESAEDQWPVVPQHVSCMALLGTSLLLIGYARIPLLWLCAILIDVGLMCRILHVDEGPSIACRVHAPIPAAFANAAQTAGTALLEQVVAGRWQSIGVNVCIAAAAACAKTSLALLLMAATSETPAVVPNVTAGAAAWLVLAALSQRSFSKPFAGLVVVFYSGAFALLLAASGQLSQWRFAWCWSLSSFVFCAGLVLRSNDVIFKPAMRSKQSGSHPSHVGRRPAPRKRRT